METHSHPARIPGPAAAFAGGVLLLLLAVLALLVSASPAQAQEALSCENYLERFARTSPEARQFAAACGHDLSPTPTPTPTPPPTPTATPEPPLTRPAEDPALLELDERLEALVADYGVSGFTDPGDYAIAVTDLQTGETISVGGERMQLAGCVINFFAILQATIDVQNGRYPEARVGDLISRTIYSSNPVTARELYEIIGGGDLRRGLERTAELVRSLGLEHTVLDHAPLYSHVARLRGGDNWTTALDTNTVLASIWAAEVLSPEWRDYLLAKMEDVKPGLQYLTAYGNGGVTSHKNGFFVAYSGEWWVDNDIGIVRFTRGGTEYAYAISFLSQHVPEEYADIPLFQRAAELIWQHFSLRYS